MMEMLKELTSLIWSLLYKHSFSTNSVPHAGDQRGLNQQAAPSPRSWLPLCCWMEPLSSVSKGTWHLSGWVLRSAGSADRVDSIHVIPTALRCFNGLLFLLSHHPGDFVFLSSPFFPSPMVLFSHFDFSFALNCLGVWLWRYYWLSFCTDIHKMLESTRLSLKSHSALLCKNCEILLFLDSGYFLYFLFIGVLLC